MVVDWKVTIVFNNGVWRWRAMAESYLPLSGIAENQDEAEAVARTAVKAAVAKRVQDGGDTRQFIVSVDEADFT